MTTFNQDIYASLIREWVYNIGDHDVAFLCNKAASMYQRINDPCTDNFRVSLVVNDQPSASYLEALDGGCCGFIYEDYTNPLTGNTYRIGFNYGH